MDYIVRNVLGEGSFNCARTVQSPLTGQIWVLRTGLLFSDNVDSKNMIRGAEILAKLQSSQNELGPSLVIEPYPFQLFDREHVPAVISDHWCSKQLERMQTAKYERVLVQHLELLGGGEVGNLEGLDTENKIACVFSLMWFLVTSKDLFQLHHGDLNSRNIVFREYESPVQMSFQNLYHFRVSKIPVIIDYDRALFTNVKMGSFSIGSLPTTPPEVIAAHLLKRTASIRGYDWWSLGMVFLQMILGFPLKPFVGLSNNFGTYFLSALMYKKIVDQYDDREKMIDIPDNHSWYQIISKESMTRALTARFWSYYNMIPARLEENVPGSRQLIARLLDIDPTVRIFGLEELLEYELFSEYTERHNLERESFYVNGR